MKIEEIDNIVRNLDRKILGSFLHSLTEAWLRADPSNKRILKPAMETILEKYPDVFKR